MSPDLVLAVAGALATVLGGWNARQGRKARQLGDEVTRQGAEIASLNKQVGQLSAWRTTATEYIGQLFFVLAVHGIPPPQPPDELGLSAPNVDHDEQEE